MDRAKIGNIAGIAVWEFAKRVMIGGAVIGLMTALLWFFSLQAFFWTYCAPEIMWVAPESGGWVCNPDLALDTIQYLWIPALVLAIAPPWPGRPFRRLAVYVVALAVVLTLLLISTVLTPAGFPDSDTIREMQQSRGGG